MISILQQNEMIITPFIFILFFQALKTLFTLKFSGYFFSHASIYKPFQEDSFKILFDIPNRKQYIKQDLTT